MNENISTIVVKAGLLKVRGQSFEEDEGLHTQDAVCKTGALPCDGPVREQYGQRATDLPGRVGTVQVESGILEKQHSLA